MKTLVTYFSSTGQTKKVAEAIFDVIQGDKEILPMKKVDSLEEYDLTFIGYPVNNDKPSKVANKFIRSKASGKKVAMFVTHASGPEMEGLPEGLAEGTIENCKKLGSKVELLGFYDCLGELDEKVANMLSGMDDPNLKAFGAIRPYTVGHPDETELENARIFAKEIMENL